MAGQEKIKRKSESESTYFTKQRVFFLILAAIIILSWVLSLVVRI